MARHFRAVLGGMTAHVDAHVSALQMLDDPGRQKLLTEWNASALPVAFRPVHRQFEERAAKDPQTIALAEGERTLSYAELNTRANRLARWLHKKRVGREVAVAVCLPRSVDMVVAQLAVSKTGAHFVSLDASNPPDRLALMAREARVACVVTSVAADWSAPAVDIRDL